MGKEVDTLKKWNRVFILTFITSKFDHDIAVKYKNDYFYKTVNINKWTKLLHVLFLPILPNFFAARSSIRFAFHIITMIKKNNIEAVHAEYSSMGQYFGLIRWLFPSIKINLVEHDVTIQSYERMRDSAAGIIKFYYEWQCKLIKKAEASYCRKADTVIVFNEKDKSLIQKYYKIKDVRVLNPYYGIDEKIEFQSNYTNKGKNICFLGQMSRKENYEAAYRLIQISKLIKKNIPDLQVYIVGNNPPQCLKAEENEYIHVTGYVEKVDSYILKCQLAVFPLLLGAGIKLKVLRSLALGVPVITGKIGAEGIDEEGKIIVLAESNTEYQLAVEELLNDDKKRQALSEKSKVYAINNFGWEKSIKTLRSLY
ncbi:glycosyltransferase family 4 protein [Lacrimispora sp. JR3]|uniref:glycosyltransferase family 4 protein n=1 Tax=Lacrimispora sinapis TaxID=3111456 RepID=UPI0037485B9E